MKSAKLSNMRKGWFVGNFEPTLWKTEDVEAAVKTFLAGETEVEHYHKIATEITVVVSGRIRMFNQEWEAGDIVITEPGDLTSFEALSDTVLTVLKLPGVTNDKYIPC